MNKSKLISRIAVASAAALCLLPSGAEAQTDHGAENTLRIMSYNILNGKQIDGKTFNYERQISVVRGMNADLVTLDEVDSITERSKGHFVLREYAAALGMHHFYSPTIDFQVNKRKLSANGKTHFHALQTRKAHSGDYSYLCA